MGLMTIRDYLKRRGNVFGLLLVTVAVALFVCVQFMPRNVTPFAPVLGLLILVASALPMLLLFRCPRCNVNLGSLASHFGPFSSLARKPVRYCPFCGADFEQQLGRKS